MFVSKVEHPFGIGTDFVVSGERCVADGELSVGLTLLIYDQLLAFKNVALLIEQLDVEYLGQGLRRIIIGENHVGLIPDGVAQEIAVVVEVQVDFLLHGQYCLWFLVWLVGESRKKGQEHDEMEENLNHWPMNFDN